MTANIIPSLMATGFIPPSFSGGDGNEPDDSGQLAENQSATSDASISDALLSQEARVSPNSPEPDLWIYRERTVALLRRYLRLSVEVGRLPSLLGREFFRTKITYYKASTFEDAVIFVHDVERSLEKLDEFDGQLIATIVLQEYSHEEAGRLLRCGHRTVARRFPEALDQVSQIFLQRGILNHLPTRREIEPEACQEGETSAFRVSDSEQVKNNFQNLA